MLETLFAMNPATIAAFTSAGILLNLTPGADVAFATASGVSGGPRAGIAAAIGISLGSLVHVALAVLGLSAALLALPHGYDIVRYLGAAYLAYLAVKTWRSAGSLADAQGEASLYTALKRGFLTNLFNPKVALFILAFLPQFTDQAAGPVWQQMLILGLIFNTTGILITGAFGAAAGLARAQLSRYGAALGKFTSIIFGGLAVRLIWE